MLAAQRYILRARDNPQKILRFTLEPDGTLSVAEHPRQQVKILRCDDNGLVTVLWGDQVLSAIVTSGGEGGEALDVAVEGRKHALRLREATLDAMREALVASQHVGGADEIRSPIPGLVKAVLVKAGDKIASGQTAIVLEAMKMENEIAAPHAATVTSVEVQPGQAVAAGALLLKLQHG
ncbi:MAG TPA: biotin/lipoyl-containing protein [Planctomycetota bacterium]|jgi:biotin carboxyl carrier protein